MIHSFADQRSSKTTVAAEALAHRTVFDGLALGQWYSVVSPAESAISNPASLAIGWGYPNLNAGVAVVDLQSPLGLEFGDCAVLDGCLFEGVHHDEVVFAKNQLGFYPEQIGGSSHENRNRKIKHEDTGASWVENRLGQEDGIQDKRQTGPNQVAFRAKNCIHASIIAGVTAVGKGK
ncbi:MAG: hypothetical protein RL612_545 [Actinomycetota bacterium]